MPNQYTEHVMTFLGAPMSYRKSQKVGGGMELVLMIDDLSRKAIIDLTDHNDFVFEFRVYAPELGSKLQAGDAASYIEDEDWDEGT